MFSLRKLPPHGSNYPKVMPEYPIRLLPQAAYTPRMNRNRLIDIDPYLQRKSFLAMKDCCFDDNPDNVTPAAFGNSGLYRMSVNILGGLFRIGDEIWHQSLCEEDVWNGGEVDMQRFEDRYEPRKIEASVYFKFSSANDIQWTFPKRFGSKDERNEWEEAIVDGLTDKEIFEKETEYQIKAHSECHHNPNMLNYWHMEIKSIIDRKPEEEIADTKQKFKKKALRGMIEILRPNSSLRPPSNIPSLPEDLYFS